MLNTRQKLWKKRNNHIKENNRDSLYEQINELEMEDDVTIFDRCKSVIENNDGKMLICGNEFVDNFDFAPDELSAIKILSTC